MCPQHNPSHDSHRTFQKYCLSSKAREKMSAELRCKVGGILGEFAFLLGKSFLSLSHTGFIFN